MKKGIKGKVNQLFYLFSMFYLLILNSKNCLNSLNSLINKMTINIPLILLIVALNFNISLAKTITKISKTSAPKIMTQTIIVTTPSTQQPTGIIQL